MYTDLKKSEIPKAILAAFPEYRGRKIKARVSHKVTFCNLNWDGGIRSEYRIVRLEDGERLGVPGNQNAPWNNPMEGQILDIPAGFVVVELAHYRGNDSLYLTVHPDNAAKLLEKSSG